MQKKDEKLTKKQRLEICHLIDVEHLSYCEVARRYNVSDTLIPRIVSYYKRYGKFSRKQPKDVFTSSFKLEVIGYMQINNLPLSQIALHYGLSETTVRVWLNKYKTQQVMSLFRETKGKMRYMKKSTKEQSKQDPNAELLKELEYLRAENAYLKKLRALVQQRIARENGSERKSSKD